MTFCLRKYADYVLFDSQQAKDAFVQLAGRDNPRFNVLYCGTNLNSFSKEVDVNRVRVELEYQEA